MLNAKNTKMSKFSFLSSKQIHNNVKHRWKRENIRKITLYYYPSKRILGHHTKERQLFLEEMTSELYCGVQVRINKVKKETGTGELKGISMGKKQNKEIHI